VPSRRRWLAAAGISVNINTTPTFKLGHHLCGALDELETNSAHGVYAAAAIKLLLLTGARVNEVLQARWDWVDWDRRLAGI
jgi:integrase